MEANNEPPTSPVQPAPDNQTTPAKRPNQHLALVSKPSARPILSVLFMVLFAATGIYVVTKSHAATDVSATLPQTITVEANDTSTTETAFTWQNSSLSGITAYQVLKNGSKIATITAPYAKNYILANLTPSTAYTITIKGLKGSVVAESSNSLAVTTGATSTAITQCGQTFGTGNYVLSGNITSTASGNCVTFANASNVSLDCQGHSLEDSNTTAGTLFNFNNVTHFLLFNCDSTTFRDPVDAENSSYGTIAQNSFSTAPDNIDVQNAGVYHSGFYVGSSTFMVIKRNTLTNVTYTASYAGGSNNNTQPLSGSNYFGFNTVDDRAVPYLHQPVFNFYLVFVDGGNHNVVDTNTLEGNSAYATGYSAGTDDGVILDNDAFGPPYDNGVPTTDSTETGDIVVNNVTTGTYDTGVETVGYISNTTIAGNTISNSEQAVAVGAFYSNSWKNVTVENNTAGPLTEYLLYFDQQFTPGTNNEILPIGQSHFYFADNNFTGNTYALQPSNPLSAETSYIEMDGASSGPGVITAQNNTFTNNNFGVQNETPYWFPYTTPNLMVVDGGGNVCRLPSTSPPNGPYPLKCLATASPTPGAKASTSKFTPPARHPKLPPR